MELCNYEMMDRDYRNPDRTVCTGRRQAAAELRGGRRRTPEELRRNAARKRMQKRRRRKRAVKRFCAVVLELAVCAAVILTVKYFRTQEDSSSKNRASAEGLSADTGLFSSGVSAGLNAEEYPEELSELLELNEEARDYVEGYPDREKYSSQPVDMTQDFRAGEVPLLMQWDKRWGYNAYGEDMIGLSGCGPVCLTMAYLYFTGDTAMTPREMAEFAWENGYYTEGGTSWSLWTEGAAKLGLEGSELSLDEKVMQNALDGGGLIVCSMRPGDFTTTGHFILIRGYDENGFYVNDPNRRSNSEKQWDFDTLRPQIKNLWVLCRG